MIIPPKSKVLESDTRIIFKDLFLKGDFLQARKGRYIANFYNGIPMEALLLDENDNIIDGFVGYSMPYLPWKRVPFIVHLGGKAEEWDPEFMDKHIWK